MKSELEIVVDVGFLILNPKLMVLPAEISDPMVIRICFVYDKILSLGLTR
jgi:hypothetical protein